jgi:hypothetical protein
MRVQEIARRPSLMQMDASLNETAIDDRICKNQANVPR